MNLYSNAFKLISIGNRKIHNNTMILNCSSYQNCSSRLLGLCSISKKCYARKAEYLYMNALNFRLRQEEYVLNTPVFKIIQDFTDTLNKGKRKEKIKYLRLNEVGDFQNSNIIKKLDNVAGFLIKKYNIITYTYTHRSDLIDCLEKVRNINIIGSGFSINNNIAKVYDYKENYTNIPKNYYICDCRKNSKFKRTCNLNCFYCSEKYGNKKYNNKKLALIKH